MTKDLTIKRAIDLHGELERLDRLLRSGCLSSLTERALRYREEIVAEIKSIQDEGE